ncbi:MAG TPA: sirohydrochlorin chelatase [Pirellulaceae bacterium]|nr:sirohydrochlorin chelatase [Pirellulaceae bacterium]
MSDRDSKIGVLLVGHGTASEVGTRQFLALAGQLTERVAPLPVEPAFLEMRQPDIAAGLCRLIERGAAHHLAVPLLLFGAGHAKRDIPAAVYNAIRTLLAEAFSRQPEPSRIAKAQWSGRNAFFLASQADHLGCHRAMVELSRQRYREAVAGLSPVPPEQTALVLVGRGSRNESATAEMHEFAQLRHQPAVEGDIFVSFLAMTQPSLAEMLPLVAARRFRRVVVQPHLLFEGDLAENIRRAVSEIQSQHPDQEWLITPLLADGLETRPTAQDSPLRGNELLLRVLEDRIQAAIVAAGVGD